MRTAVQHGVSVLATVGLVLAAGVVPAQDFARFENARIGQQRARELAVKLMSEVLDTQLRRLDENSLSHVPLYAEVASLRRNIDGLVESEMAAIADLLDGGRQADARSDPVRLARARGLARQVVVRLMVERQRIRKRLRVAQTATMVEQLIELQLTARRKAEQLESGDLGNRDVETVKVFHDQADIGMLLAQLETTLEEIASWAGAQGTSATEALERFRKDQVIAISDKAKTSLGRGDFREALPHQQSVLATLYSIYHALGRAQGIAALNRAAALRLIQRLIREQRRLHRETQQTDLADDSHRDRLAGKQRSLRRDLDALPDLLQANAIAVANAAEASQAAQSAERALFEGQRTAATGQQQRVIALLSAVDSLLRDAELTKPTGNGTDGQNAQLDELNQAVDRALELQARATELAAGSPQQAAELEQQVADQLTASRDGQSLAEAMERAFDQAEQAVSAAQQVLNDSADPAARRQSTSQAEDALSELAAEIKSAMPGDAQNARTPPPTGDDTEAGDQSGRQESQESSDSGTEQGMPQDDPTGSQDENTMLDSRTADSQQDAAVGAKRFENEPWFARLPPGLQRAIQTRTRQSAPRGYEERLRRYFRSLD